jgi:hypothetical protein
LPSSRGKAYHFHREITLENTMAGDSPKSKTAPAPKAEATPAAKSEAAPAAKSSTPEAAPAKTDGGEKTSAAPASYSRGEGQKPVTQAYKDNWNAIFAKKKRPTRAKSGAKKR